MRMLVFVTSWLCVIFGAVGAIGAPDIAWTLAGISGVIWGLIGVAGALWA